MRAAFKVWGKRLGKFIDWWDSGKVGLIFLTGALVSGVLGYLQTHPEGFNLQVFLADYYANFSTELASIAITILIIDTLNRRRDKIEQQRHQAEVRALQERHRRELLIRQMGSSVNSEAVRASEELRVNGWLGNGALVNARLEGADLAGAPLNHANLRGVQLHRANLSKAHLFRACLEGAGLGGADLRGAYLKRADLRRAFMAGCKLEGATGFSIESVCLAHRLKGATMPDGTRYDGRFRLEGDLRVAVERGHDPADPASMAAYYVIEPEVYLAGQQWAAEHLERFIQKANEPGWLGPADGDWVEADDTTQVRLPRVTLGPEKAEPPPAPKG